MLLLSLPHTLLAQYSLPNKGFYKITGVNFTNVLRKAFTLVDSKSVKRLIVIFAHLGSVCLKALRKTLMKLSPGMSQKQCHLVFSRYKICDLTIF